MWLVLYIHDNYLYLDNNEHYWYYYITLLVLHGKNIHNVTFLSIYYMPRAVLVCILAFKVFEKSPQINGDAGIWTQAYLTTTLLMLVPLCGGEWIPCHSTSNFPDKMPISRADISMWSSYQFLSLEKSMFYCCTGVNGTALESKNKRDYNGNKSGCCLHRKWHLEAFPVRAPCWVHYNVNNQPQPTEMATCVGSC